MDTRIAVPCPNKPDELTELTTNVNQMATDLQGLLEAKRGLLLAISHELRSPLTRARVSLELLDASPSRDRLAADLQTMNRLIHELLELERLSDRHAALQTEPVDLVELIQTLIAEEFPADDPARHIDTRLELDTPVTLDATRIRLLLRKLLDNALQHTPPGQPAPSLTLTRQGERLQIKVQDHGAAIPPEHLSHLTEPFYRADSARQRSTGGFGLGLYLCRLIAEAHQGRLEITSSAQQGSCVTVELPLLGLAGESQDSPQV